MTKYKLICEVWMTEKASWQGLREHVITFSTLREAKTKRRQYDKYLAEQIREVDKIAVSEAEEKEFSGLCVLWAVHGIEKETRTNVISS